MADVVVIGAGVAGLTAAYRLQRHGHRVTVLEAKPRAGGLSHTARQGSVVTELDDDGQPVHQTATIDDGLYVNLGPGRLPHHHRRILALCAELGVRLEPYIMSSDANYWADARTKRRYRRRRVEHDTRGYLAELAYAEDDPAARRDLVRAFGDLTLAGRYQGTPRAGDGTPLQLAELERTGFWRNLFWQPAAYLWQDTMFEPVGGMDMVWRALLAHVADRVVYNAAVDRVRTSATGVKVTWQQSGDTWSGRWDWCLSSIPLPLLAGLRLQGFSRDYLDAIATPEFAPACKVGWQSNTRWWESDTEQIYGGISYTNHVIQQFWYPSSGFGQPTGTLTGAYNSYAAAERFGDRGIIDRIELARRGGTILHPEVADDDLVPINKALTVAWHRVPHQAGGWCDWQPARPKHQTAFTRLQDADGRFLAIGDQVSPWPGWQEGCVITAQRGIDIVDGAIPSARPVTAPPVEVPDSAWLTTADHPQPAVLIDDDQHSDTPESATNEPHLSGAPNG